jgi:hypothetical protein
MCRYWPLLYLDPIRIRTKPTWVCKTYICLVCLLTVFCVKLADDSVKVGFPHTKLQQASGHVLMELLRLPAARRSSNLHWAST